MGSAFRLNVGYYFDLFSDRIEDWEKEAHFNKSLNPAFLEVMLEFPPSNQSFSAALQQKLLAAVDGVPLKAHAPTLNLSLVAPNPAISHASIQEHLHALVVAKGLGAPFLTIHGGEYPFFSPSQETIHPTTLFIQNIKPVLERADLLGVELCLENLKGGNIFPKTFDELDFVFERYPSLAMALDVRHFVVEGFDPTEAMLRYFSRIRSIHYRVDNGLSDEKMLVFIRTLRELNYQGCFIIEDRTLNTMDKDNKELLHAGRAKIGRLVNALQEGLQ